MTFYEICRQGDLDQVKECISKLTLQRGITSEFLVNWGFGGACNGGHLPIVLFLIEKGAKSWNEGFANACRGGHMDIVQMMMEKGANDWEWGLFSACRGGHLDIVQLMIEKGAKEWDRGLNYACEYGHLAVVKLMIEKGAKNINEALWHASNEDRMDIAAMILDTCAIDLSCVEDMFSYKKEHEIYSLVTKDETRLRLERYSPAIKRSMRVTTIVVLNDRLPEHLIRTIVMEYL